MRVLRYMIPTKRGHLAIVTVALCQLAQFRPNHLPQYPHHPQAPRLSLVPATPLLAVLGLRKTAFGGRILTILDHAEAAGIKLSLRGDKVVWEAASKPPDSLVLAIKAEKANIISILRQKAASDRRSREAQIKDQAEKSRELLTPAYREAMDSAYRDALAALRKKNG
jgi:hypothetical protein